MAENFETDEITRLLAATGSGDRDAESELIKKLYPKLHRIAHALMRHERFNHTLQTTALVNEAYLRLAGSASTKIQNRLHFFAVAGRVMRRILVDYARGRLTDKRGAQYKIVEWDESLIKLETHPSQILEIDELLHKLSGYDERQARVVEMKVFAGLTDQEIAEILQVNVRTVKRDWSMAKAWLHGQLEPNRKQRNDA